MLGSIKLYVHVHFMDSGKTRKVFGAKVGGQSRGRHTGNFLCMLFLVYLLVGVFLMMKPHICALHSTMRFRISGAINKAGWAKGGKYIWARAARRSGNAWEW